MKRTLWTVGMSLVEFCFGWYVQGYPLNCRELVISTTSAGCIGFGLGSIFGQPRPGVRLVIYWAATLTLMGLFFGPLLPIRSFVIAHARPMAQLLAHLFKSRPTPRVPCFSLRKVGLPKVRWAA